MRVLERGRVFRRGLAAVVAVVMIAVLGFAAPRSAEAEVLSDVELTLLTAESVNFELQIGGITRATGGNGTTTGQVAVFGPTTLGLAGADVGMYLHDWVCRDDGGVGPVILDESTVSVGTVMIDLDDGDTVTCEVTSQLRTVATSITAAEIGAPGPHGPGDIVTYQLTYGNTGNDTAASGVISIYVGAHTQANLPASSPGWTCSPVSGEAGTNCTNGIGNIDAGEIGTVAFAATVVDPLPPGATESTFYVGCEVKIVDVCGNSAPVPGAPVPELRGLTTSAQFPDDPADNWATVVSQLGEPVSMADLSVSVSDSPDPASDGQPLEYTVMVTNAGPDAATNVVVNAGTVLPPALAVGSTTGCGEDPIPAPTCSLGGLAAGESASFTWNTSAFMGFQGLVQVSYSVMADEADPNSANNGDAEFTEIIASEPFQVYISSSSKVSVDGVIAEDEDILVWDETSDMFTLHFDGSDVGLGAIDLNAFHILDNGIPGDLDPILLSPHKPVMLSGIGLVDDSDVVRFDPSSLGTTTAGTFALVLDGSTVGLSRSAEDINGINVDDDGRLVVSTLGNFTVPRDGGGRLRGKNEDLIVLADSNRWSLVFDGSDVGLNRRGEEIWGVSTEVGNPVIFGTSKASFSVPPGHGLGDPVTGDSDDIWAFLPFSQGADTDGAFELAWDGDDHGVGDEQLDGIQVMNSSFGP